MMESRRFQVLMILLQTAVGWTIGWANPEPADPEKRVLDAPDVPSASTGTELPDVAALLRATNFDVNECVCDGI